MMGKSIKCTSNKYIINEWLRNKLDWLKRFENLITDAPYLIRLNWSIYIDLIIN